MWDASGKLASVIRPDADIVSFAYDALGRRLSKKYKNTVTKWIWNNTKPLHEWKEHAKTGAKLSNKKCE
ncbi:MAG: RHS repeat protein [Chitinophagaceae bacterium]|nr:RHS repeat protein [Chitinophagaceae bacterium]